MTIPHLMNCPHTDSGWCAECVAGLGTENWRQHDEIAALRKDAERYRWLRSSETLDGPHIYGPDDDCILGGAEADEAVDDVIASVPAVG